jgi:hypothetical protein
MSFFVNKQWSERESLLLTLWTLRIGMRCFSPTNLDLDDARVLNSASLGEEDPNHFGTAPVIC